MHHCSGFNALAVFLSFSISCIFKFSHTTFVIESFSFFFFKDVKVKEECLEAKEKRKEDSAMVTDSVRPQVSEPAKKTGKVEKRTSLRRRKGTLQIDGPTEYL